jgi:hypothetical protein
VQGFFCVGGTTVTGNFSALTMVVLVLFGRPSREGVNFELPSGFALLPGKPGAGTAASASASASASALEMGRLPALGPAGFVDDLIVTSREFVGWKGALLQAKKIPRHPISPIENAVTLNFWEYCMIRSSNSSYRKSVEKIELQLVSMKNVELFTQ